MSLNNLAQCADAKVCLTASGALIHQGKILLVKHKKLGAWLSPGGHVEPNELLHQAAEREFWEETAIKVRAISALPVLAASTVFSHMPVPYRASWHWVCEENYQMRTKKGATDSSSLKKSANQKKWKKGCEQHIDYGFLVEPVVKGSEGLKFRQNMEESDGISWFSLEELIKLEKDNKFQAELNKEFIEAFKFYETLNR